MTIGDVRQVNIDAEMRSAYLDYAMSVIVSRALPDARDGLKPVHRRILYAMHDMGLGSDTSFKKSARIVGEVLGKYHPHGDAAVYETMVRLAQDFAMRYPLVDGQGNFGSMDGDGAAAMRYTEARLARIGEEMLVDIAKATVDYTDNFDGSLQEPVVLPAALPNLLVNGASGIAVGMSTNIPPHNINEVCDALVYMLDQWDALEEVGTDTLMGFIHGPDFPTGGLVYRHKDSLDTDDDTLVSAYATGRGKLTVRARVHVEDIVGRGRNRIVVTELPYQVNKSTLIERIAALVQEDRLKGLSDLRDESDRHGMRIVIDLQRGADVSEVLAALFKLTPMQDTFSVILLALVDGQPRVLTLKQCLKVYLDHRLVVVRRRSEYDLARAQERAHVLEGLLKALDNLDTAIAIIRNARNADVARTDLMRQLVVTEVQAQAILDMQLRRLAALERKKIADEHAEKVKLMKYLNGLLASPTKMRAVVAGELADVKQEYGNARRTVIVDETATHHVRAEAFMLPEQIGWLSISFQGRVGRLDVTEPPRVNTDVADPPRLLVEASTAHVLLLIAQDGQCALVPVQQLPQITQYGEGTPFHELTPLPASTTLVAAFSLPPSAETGTLFLATRDGQVKRVRLADLPVPSGRAFSVMNVGDSALVNAFITQGDDQVLLATERGMSIRFEEDEVRPTGLPAGGMRGIRLADDDAIVSAARLTARDAGNTLVWTMTADGAAKVSTLDEYPLQGRAGLGVVNVRLAADGQGVAAVALGKAKDTVTVLTRKGKPRTLRLGAAPAVKRGRSGGDFVLSVKANDAIAGLMIVQPRVVLPLPTSPQNGAAGGQAAEHVQPD